MRISFELEEVLLVDPAVQEAEDSLPFPLNRLFPERLRRGTPALFSALQQAGDEVWIYTATYRTETWIRAFLRHYGVWPDQVVSGYRHDEEVQPKTPKRILRKEPGHYAIRLHVDTEGAEVLASAEDGVRVLTVSPTEKNWTERILAEAKTIRDAAPGGEE